MKEYLKRIVFSLIGKNRVINAKKFIILILNFYNDFKLYYIHSTVFKLDIFQKYEALLIIEYHRIEKGLLFINIKPRFAERSIVNLHSLLIENNLIALIDKKPQIKIAIDLLIKYYNVHSEMNIDISDYYTKSQYDYFLQFVTNDSIKGGIICLNKIDFYNSTKSNFKDFANSRKSIRDFTGELVELDIIKSSIQLAITSPSVCNRQANKVYYIEDKILIKKILKVQGGFNGYIENVSQLLILTNNRNYYYSIGERNQMYIDGGIFLMNLLYALHYYEIACCPANWGKEINDEKILKSIYSIPNSEKIICLIPIGIAKSEIRITKSHRRDVEEIFEFNK